MPKELLNAWSICTPVRCFIKHLLGCPLLVRVWFVFVEAVPMHRLASLSAPRIYKRVRACQFVAPCSSLDVLSTIIRTGFPEYSAACSAKVVANHKRRAHRVRPWCFVERASAQDTSAVPVQATWLRQSITQISRPVSSWLRLVPVRSLCHHHPNRTVKRDARTIVLFHSYRSGRAPLTFFRWASTGAL
jgi:hypothetical protein